MALTPDVIEKIAAIVGPKGIVRDEDSLAAHLKEWRGQWHGHTPALVLPASSAEVSEVLRLCNAHVIPVVTQGGNTGLVGGQIPFGELLVSTRRMRAVRDVSRLDDAITVEAGVTLAETQTAAAEIGRRFPLSLAAEASATIGGVISTNAGGTAVLRYGVMRDLVLGLEAVLPTGEVFRGLKRLRKDNTGYDIKQLLIGAEGTLGIITAASLKLVAPMRSIATAMLAVPDPHSAVALLARAREETAGGVEAFELMKRIGVELALANVPGNREPLEAPSPWYVLIELGSGEEGAAQAAMDRLLEAALAEGLVSDGAIAQNETQRAAFWKLREDQSAAQKPEGPGWKHDISVPVSSIADFIDEAGRALEARYPGVRISAFGHVGDGNVHYDVMAPAGGDRAAFMDLRDEGMALVHDIVARLHGSISAEHGLGRLKSEQARAYKSATEIDLQQRLRRALDPNGIMNPGVLF
ncbi:MAG: FAD-binding oxidoreductase [Brevundimonas sp.]|uniref:FAD-binding oxidoreductase n=1 Tax=Brevundimonas sp. TaxID=1871086 RepID=UPI00391DB0F2